MHTPSSSEAAQIARINRRFNRIGNELTLKRCRYESPAFYELGRLYIVNWRMNVIVDTFVDADELELEVAS